MEQELVALNGVFNSVFMSTHHVGTASHQLVVDKSPNECVEYAYQSDLADNLISMDLYRWELGGLKEVLIFYVISHEALIFDRLVK